MTDRSLAPCMDALCFVANSCLELVRLCLWPRRRPKAARRVCVYRNGHFSESVALGITAAKPASGEQRGWWAMGR
jgi:hypothetical protein